jgi:hypothetical protein
MSEQVVHPAKLLKGLFESRKRNGGETVSDMELKSRSFLSSTFRSLTKIFGTQTVPEPLVEIFREFEATVQASTTEFSSKVWKWAMAQPGLDTDPMLELLNAAIVELTANGKFDEAQKLAIALKKGDLVKAKKLAAKVN